MLDIIRYAIYPNFRAFLILLLISVCVASGNLPRTQKQLAAGHQIQITASSVVMLMRL